MLRLFPATVAALLATVATAQESTAPLALRCELIEEQLVTASNAEDVDAVERIAARFSGVCASLLEADPYRASHAMGYRAMAQLRADQSKKALASARECIDTYYANVSCHATELDALIALGEIDKAREIAPKKIAFIEKVIKSEKELAQTTTGKTQKRHAWNADRYSVLRRIVGTTGEREGLLEPSQ